MPKVTVRDGHGRVCQGAAHYSNIPRPHVVAAQPSSLKITLGFKDKIVEPLVSASWSPSNPPCSSKPELAAAHRRMTTPEKR